MSSLRPGSRFGPYEVVSPLGAGGMGEVYRALDTRLGRDVALKILVSESSRDSARFRRFEAEARAAAALSHRNIVSIYDVGEADGGIPYIVSELMPGGTLTDVLTRAPLPSKKLFDLAIGIAEGLAAAHGQGIVHRDLKPDNILMAADGMPKIADFGLAKHFRPASDPEGSHLTTLPDERTKEGTILGTVGYMSPEQARGQAVDFRSDQFSFGSILYEMATGKRAFARGSTPETQAAIIREEPEPLALAVPSAPVPLRWIIERCLAKEPEERYASTRDLARDLARLRDGLSEISVSAPALSAEPSRSRSRRRPLLAALALLVIIAAGLLAARRVREEPPVYERVSFRRGTVWQARFAPDGKTIFYGASFEGKPPQIFSTRTDSTESTPLAWPRANVLSISSSGKMAIALNPGPASTLAVASLAGGAPREVLDGVHMGGADFAPGGESLAAIHWTDGRHRLEFPIGKVLYDPGPGLSLSFVRFSPKGDALALLEKNTGMSERSGDFSVVLVDLHGKKTILSSGWGDAFSLAWNPGTDEVWFTAREAGASSGGLVLHAVSRSGRHRVIARVPGILMIQDVSRDGRVLLKHTEWPTSLVCLPPGATKEVELSWLDFSRGADLSEDGKTILFDEQGIAAGAKGAVYMRKTDGSDTAVRLGEGSAIALSPDGKWAISIPTASPDRLVLFPTGAGQPRELKSPGMQYLGAKWFPDGNRVLLLARASGHRPRLYIQAVEAGDPRPVTPEGFDIGPISPDGKLVASRDPGGGVFLYPLEGGATRQVRGISGEDQVIRWDAGGGALFLACGGSGSLGGQGASLRIDRLDLASGRRERWRELGPADSSGVSGIEAVLLASDGKSYSYTYMRDLSSLYVVTGLK